MGGSILDQAPCVPDGAPVVSITICAGPGEGQSIKLRRAVSMFGSRQGGKFVLRHPAVSRRHCVIVNTGQQVILRDLDTRGRTLRNGLKAEQEVLEDADRVTVGPWEFRVDLSYPEHLGASDSPVIVDLEPDPTVLGLEEVATHRVTKLTREVAMVGRSSGADYVVQEREVSAAHAIIFTFLHKPVIFDLVSENGVFVNGQRAVFALLENDDEVSIGSHALKFRCNTPSSRARLNGSSTILKPKALPVNPDGTISDLIDLSAESKVM